MAEWSSCWAHSWYSGAPWFSAQHYGYQSQSRDWTTSPSQPRSLTLTQTSAPSSSTTPAPQPRLKLIVSTHTTGWTLNASTQTDYPDLSHSTSGCLHSCRPTQCLHHRRLHTTPACRVLSWVHLLQRPFGSLGPSTSKRECQWRLTSPNPLTSPLSTVPAAPAVPVVGRHSTCFVLQLYCTPNPPGV